MLIKTGGWLPAFCWLPRLPGQPYKARFVTNSSSCTTTELSELLTSCLATVKDHVVKYCERAMKGPVGVFFGQSRIRVRY